MSTRPAPTRLALCVSTVLALGAVAGPAARADVHADHRCNLYQRQLVTDRADYELQAALHARQQAEWFYNQTLQDLNETQRKVSAMSASMTGVRQRLANLRHAAGESATALDLAQQALGKETRRLETARKDVEALRPDVDAARKALDAATAAEVKAFESGAEVKAARLAVEASGLALDAAEQAAAEALAKREDYRKAQAALSAAEARVTQLRGRGPEAAGELAKAATVLMDAKNRLNTLTESAHDADPQVVAAREELADARAALDALHDAFEQRLAKLPRVAEAQRAFDKANEWFRPATDTLAAAGREVEALQKDVREQERKLGRARESLAIAEEDAAVIEQDYEYRQAQAEAYAQEVRRAESDIAVASARIVAAESALRKARAAEAAAVCQFLPADARRDGQGRERPGTADGGKSGAPGDVDRRVPAPGSGGSRALSDQAVEAARPRLDVQGAADRARIGNAAAGVNRNAPGPTAAPAEAPATRPSDGGVFANAGDAGGGTAGGNDRRRLPGADRRQFVRDRIDDAIAPDIGWDGADRSSEELELDAADARRSRSASNDEDGGQASQRTADATDDASRAPMRQRAQQRAADTSLRSRAAQQAERSRVNQTQSRTQAQQQQRVQPRIAPPQPRVMQPPRVQTPVQQQVQQQQQQQQARTQR